jgi:hypothetical protein
MCRCHASVPCEVPPSTRRPRLRPRGPSLWALALCPCPCRWMSVADRLVVSGGSGVAVCCIVLGWCMRCVCPRVVGCRASVAHTTHAALNAVSGRTESVHTVGTGYGFRGAPGACALEPRAVLCGCVAESVCPRSRDLSRSYGLCSGLCSSGEGDARVHPPAIRRLQSYLLYGFRV